MNAHEIPTEIFYEAHAEAVDATKGPRQRRVIASILAEILVNKLVERGQAEILGDINRARVKVRDVLEGILEKNGLEYVTKRRMALQATFFHDLADKTSLGDMPASVRSLIGGKQR